MRRIEDAPRPNRTGTAFLPLEILAASHPRVRASRRS
jgi:hypothetical protein